MKMKEGKVKSGVKALFFNFKHIEKWFHVRQRIIQQNAVIIY